LQNGDVNIEVNALEKFIKNNDKNPFASRKINPKYTKVIDDYIDFLEINNYFTDVKTTNDIRLPKTFSCVEKYSEKEINEIIDTINGVISAKKIEKILSSKYFDTILS